LIKLEATSYTTFDIFICLFVCLFVYSLNSNTTAAMDKVYLKRHDKTNINIDDNCIAYIGMNDCIPHILEDQSSVVLLQEEHYVL
jgi:hypothetical protein